MKDFGALRRFQLNKSDRGIQQALRYLVRDAYAHVPHIRKSFAQAGVDPDVIRTRTDLRRLPTVSREDLGLLRAEDVLRHGVDPRQCKISWTSGSSGRQLAVHMNRAEAFYRQLLLYNAFRRNMKGRGPLSIAEVGSGNWKSARTRRVLGAVNVTWVPRTAPLAEQADQLARSKPAVITGHPSLLELVAEQIDLERRDVSPALVACRGEILEAQTRSLLGRVFDCRVADYYSCDEAGNVAWECPNRSEILHENSDGCIVEVVDEKGEPLEEGAKGRVLLTNLFNRTMPFIRYDLGDRASVVSYADRCECGFHGLSLSPISGREMQFFRLIDGSRVSARAIATLVNRVVRQLHSDYAVSRYQVIQDDLSSIRIRLCSRQDLPQDSLTQMARSMERMGKDIGCIVEVSDQPEIGPSGKFQRYISNVPRTGATKESIG